MTGSGAAGIDMHAHAVPPGLLEAVSRRPLVGVRAEESAEGYVVRFPGGKSLRPISGIMLDFEQRQEWLDRQGMHEQIIAPWLDVHGQELPAGDGQRWVRELNDAMAQAVDPHGHRLRASVTLHLGNPESAAEELARCVTELDMTGTMIPTHVPGTDLSDPGFDALWEAAQDLDVPVTLHPPTVAPSRCLFEDDPSLKGTIGRGIDTTLAAARLIVGGVFDRFPDLKVVLVHGGGFLPYQTGRFDRDFGHGSAKGEHLQRLPSEYVQALYYDTVLLSGSALSFLLDLVGASKVMIGSDYGARPRERSGVGLTRGLDESRADPQERAAVLRATAEDLFFKA